jgi:transcriptional regulator with XRE-family HTH domain
MKKEILLITPSQCRAARALLDWTQPDLVAVTGLSAVTIRAFEKGGAMRDSNKTLLGLALEKAGVEFIPENGGGAGVRLAKPAKPYADAGTLTASIDQQKASADGVRAEAAGAVDRALADVDATKQEKVERREALTDEPAVIAKARGKGRGGKR